MEASLARGRKPLHLVFVGARAKAQQFGHGAVEPAERIRIIPLFFELQLIALRVPARAATEIAGVIQREHGGIFKRRREKGRSGVGQ